MPDLLNGSYLGFSRDELRTLIVRLVGEGIEGPKLDFKRTLSLETPAEKAEFCKDLSAIANTDDRRFGGYGYIVLGAEGTNIVGGVTAWPRGADQFSSRLTQVAKEHLAPPPDFSFVAFDDADVGDWGVVVIPPSSEQPHIFIRELAGNPAKHEWYVRVNDTTERSRIADYARVMSSAARRATHPLEVELHSLKLELQGLKAGMRPVSTDVATATTVAATDAPPDLSTAADDSLADRVARSLMSRTQAIETSLVADAMRVQRVMFEDRSENPQKFLSSTPEELLRPLVYMEEQTKPFAEALVSIVRYDDSQCLWESVVEATDTIAEEPSLTGSHWQYAQQLRLYPLVLTLYALAFVSAARNDGRLLRRVLDVELRPANREQPEPLIWSLRRLRAAKELFIGAQGQRYYEPIAERISGIVPGWCSKVVLGKRGQDVFFLAEFGLALEYTKVRALLAGTGVPFIGRFAYQHDAEQVLTRALRKRSKFLVDLFGDDVEKRLSDFDTNAARLVEGGFRRGFIGGALAAWKGENSGEG